MIFPHVNYVKEDIRALSCWLLMRNMNHLRVTLTACRSRHRLLICLSFFILGLVFLFFLHWPIQNHGACGSFILTGKKSFQSFINLFWKCDFRELSVHKFLLYLQHNYLKSLFFWSTTFALILSNFLLQET